MKPDDFEELSSLNLEKLESLFSESGSKVTRTALLRAVPSIATSSIGRFEELQAEGWSPKQIAYLINQLARARNSAQRLSHIIDLVISGPAASTVPMRSTAAVFREMVSVAEEEVILASYAIYNGKDIFQPLVERWQEVPNLKVRLYIDIPRKHGDTTLDVQLVARYRKQFIDKEWPGERLPELFYFKSSLEEDWKERASMHAKVALIDGRTGFVTSANLTNAAQQKNIEVGVRLNDTDSVGRLENYLSELEENGTFLRF